MNDRNKTKNIELTTINNRIMFIDIARGITIILMIIGHVINNGWKRDLIFSFHMPLFIFVSGLFFKERDLKSALKVLICKLFIPTVLTLFIVTLINSIPKLGLFNSIINALKTILIGWSHQFIITYNFDGTGVLWFIYLIIGIRLIFLINKKVSNGNDIYLLCIVLFETYIGYIVGTKGFWLPWSIDVAFASILFYYLGYIFKKYDLLKKVIDNEMILPVLFLIWIIGIKCNPIELAVRKYPNGLWCYITAIAGLLIVLKMSQLMENKLKYCSKALAWCGRNSLYILIGHHIELSLISYDILFESDILYKITVSFFKITVSIIISLCLATVNLCKNKNLIIFQNKRK